MPRQKQQQQLTKDNIMKSILDQFKADAINAPETVTGGTGRRTHRRTRGRTRTRTGRGSSSVMSGRRTHRRTHRRTRTHRG
jgi:hypothetical protein